MVERGRNKCYCRRPSTLNPKKNVDALRMTGILLIVLLYLVASLVRDADSGHLLTANIPKVSGYVATCARWLAEGYLACFNLWCFQASIPNVPDQATEYLVHYFPSTASNPAEST